MWLFRHHYIREDERKVGDQPVQKPGCIGEAVSCG